MHKISHSSLFILMAKNLKRQPKYLLTREQVGKMEFTHTRTYYTKESVTKTTHNMDEL